MKADEAFFTEEGARIRAARAYAGWSREALAEKLGVHADTIRRYEQGRIPGTARARERLLLDIGRITNAGPWVAYGNDVVETAA